MGGQNLPIQVLTDDDLSAKGTQLKQARESCAQLAAQLEQGENRLQKPEDVLSRREVNLRKLDDQNELLCLGHEHNRYVHSLQAERFVADSQVLFAALRQRSRQIGEFLRALQKAEEARTVYDNAALHHFDRRTLPIFRCVDYKRPLTFGLNRIADTKK